jgi:hypothetical protein
VPATIYLGAPGSGKSTLMRTHVTEIVRGNPDTVILIVNHGERPGEPSWHDLPGAQVYHTVDAWWTTPSRVAVFEGVPGSEVARLAIAVGWSVYVDDEIDGALRDGSWLDSPLRRIVKEGRHVANRAGEITSVVLMCATHRPASLPTDLQGLFDRAYIGRLYAWNDADRVRREGWCNGRNVEEVQGQLAALAPSSPYEPGPRHFLTWPT